MKRNPVTNKIKAPDLRPKHCVVWIDEDYKVDLSSFERFVESYRNLALLAIRGYDEYVPLQPDDHDRLMDAIYTEVWQKRARLMKVKNRLRFVIHLMIGIIHAYCSDKGWQKQLTQMSDGWRAGTSAVQHETAEQVNKNLFG